MSADNGIYILKSEGPEWRIAHAQAIENINWNEETKSSADQNHFNMEEVKQYFGESRVFLSEQDVCEEAVKMETEICQSDFPVLEYGICEIRMPHKFPK